VGPFKKIILYESLIQEHREIDENDELENEKNEDEDSL
jgi:hypothetical protein